MQTYIVFFVNMSFYFRVYIFILINYLAIGMVAKLQFLTGV